MEKTKLKSLFIIFVFLCVVGCAVCLVGCQKYYWNYDCDWVSDDPKIELYKGCGSGRMTIDNVEYEFYTAQSNNATYITFYEKDTKSVIWKADTKLKNEKLYLTVTIDNISNFQGNTIVFLQKEIE